MSERHRQLRSWSLIAALLALAVGLAIVFSQALRAAQSLEAWNHEFTFWSASQLEIEFLRLVNTADRYVESGKEDPAELDRRIDILWSRLAVFDAGSSARRLNQIPGARAVVEALKASLKEIEADLRTLSAGDVDAYAPLRERLLDNAAPVHDMATNVMFTETRGALGELEGLRGNFILAAGLISALLVVGVVLIGFLVAEIASRRRLLNAMLLSQEQARQAREREEAALIESGRRFHAIAKANPVAILVTDTRDGTVRYANPAAVTLLGLPGEGPLDVALGDLFPDHEDMRAVIEAGIQGVADHHETSLRHADGSAFPVALSARSLDYGGAPCLVFGVLDLTEKQAAQAEIERQRETIHHREKLGALGSLLAGVAHELNNPLSVVVAQAALLEELATDPKIAGRGEKIRLAADRCARIVRTFLAMARQKPPTRAAVDVNAAVNASLELLGYSLRTAGIEVRRDFAAELPPVWGDGDQIGQVLTNLIVNAQQVLADWSRQRCLTLRTRFEAAAGMVEIAVLDSGPGVAPAIRSRIFEPFFTTKPIGFGTGIGLSVCHGVVTSHGGTIAVEDAPGGGGAFIVRLPVGSGTAASESLPKQAAPPADGGRILIVDDEAEVAGTLSDILLRDGYRIDLADGGQSALRLLRGNSFDLILSDLRMPNMDGMEFYRRLRELRPELADSFIAMTGDTLSATVRSFLDETGRPCLEKPFVPAEVRRLVAAAFAARRQTGASRA